MSKTKKWLLLSSIGIALLIAIIVLSIAIVVTAKKVEVKTSMNVSFVAKGVYCTVGVKGKYKKLGTESVYTAITATPSLVSFGGTEDETSSIATSEVEIDSNGVVVYTFTITNQSTIRPIYAKISVGDTINLTRVLTAGEYTYLPEGQAKGGYYIAPAGVKEVELTITITNSHLDAEADTDVSVYLYDEPEAGVTKLLDRDGTILYIADQIGETFEAPYNSVTTEINDGGTKYFQGWKKDGSDTVYAPYDLITAEANAEYKAYYAADPTYSDLTFEEKTDGTFAVKGNNSSATSITIPAIYHGKPVTTIGSANASTTVAALPDNISNNKDTDIIISGDKNIVGAESTSVGAFVNYSSLTSIVIPKSVTLIGFSAFAGCSNLTDINLPSNLNTIGTQAFSRCTSLTEVEIPESVESIGERVFEACTALTTVTLPDSLSVITRYLFNSCSALTTVNCPSGLTRISDYAFQSTALTTFDMSNAKKLTYIGNQAFQSTKLISVYIPSNVATISPTAFLSVSTLQTIKVARDNTTFSSVVAGVEYNCIIKNGTSLVLGCAATIIPNTIESIEHYAMMNAKVTSITIPATVTSIGERSFAWTALTSVTFEAGTKPLVIGTRAFQNCTNLTTIQLPTRITKIEKGAFYNCTKLTSVSFGSANNWKSTTSSTFTSGSAINVSTAATNATTFKGNNASYYYRDSTALLDLDGTVLYEYNNVSGTQDLPVVVPTISKAVGAGTWYFQGWNDAGSLIDMTLWLKPYESITVTSATNYQPHYYIQEEYTDFTLYFNSSTNEFGVGKFETTSSNNWGYDVPVVYRGYPVTHYLSSIFDSNTSINTLCVPRHIVSVPDNYYNRVKISDIIVDNKNIKYSSTDTNGNQIHGLLTKDREILQMCIDNTTIPSSVRIIDSQSISACTITSLTIPEGVVAIKKDAFSLYSKIKTITLPNSLVICEDDLSNITTYTTYNNGNYIGNSTNPYIFLKSTTYSTITTFDIHADTKIIGYQAFYSGSKLTSITIPSNVKSIGKYAFRSCSTLASISLPDGLLYIGEYAFNGCTKLTTIQLPDNLKFIGYWNIHNWRPTTTTYNNVKYIGSQSNPYMVAYGYSGTAGTFHADTKIINNNYSSSFTLTEGVECVDSAYVNNSTSIPASVKYIRGQRSGYKFTFVDTTASWYRLNKNTNEYGYSSDLTITRINYILGTTYGMELVTDINSEYDSEIEYIKV